jgi:hypothetical protein
LLLFAPATPANASELSESANSALHIPLNLIWQSPLLN